MYIVHERSACTFTLFSHSLTLLPSSHIPLVAHARICTMCAHQHTTNLHVMWCRLSRSLALLLHFREGPRALTLPQPHSAGHHRDSAVA